MLVLIVSALFPPEPVVSSQTSAQIAQVLAERGYDVIVIAPFPSRPSGKLYPGFSLRLFQRQRDRGGFELVRCFSLLSPESRLLSRFLENVSFGLTGGWAVLTSRRPDVIYANTWPIFAAGILAIVSRLRRIPMVISVQDVYPESLVSQGRIRTGSWMARWMRWMDGLIARGCQAVIVISDSFAALYCHERRVASDRLHVVPNWVDSKSIIPDDDRANGFRASRGIPPDAFVVVYGGNIGMAAGVETIIESFRFLQDIENLYLVIAGMGNNLIACQNLAKKISDQRILFHTPWPVDETSLVLSAADVLILPTRGSQSVASVPSKFISYILAARPVIALALSHSDLAVLVQRSGGGWIVEPDQPELLAAKIREVRAMDPAVLVRRGKAGRVFALQQFTREVCLPRVIDVLEKAAQQKEHR